MAADAFHTTRWTLVRNAAGPSSEAREALSELCAAYYPPVYAYVARTARDLGDPRDLTQEFFARLLAGTSLGADPGRGRFRGYLLGAVKHFLADRRVLLSARKRGGDCTHMSIEAGTDTSPGLDVPAPEDPLPDAWFDREWGLAVLAQALSALAAEHDEQDKAARFVVLKQWLTGDAPPFTQASAAQQLGITEGALKVAIHRLRQRFRELVKAQIGQTVSTEAEVRDELRYLIEVVG